MVVKTGLMLGQMTDGDRLLALSLPAWRLQEGREHTESEVNAARPHVLTRPAVKPREADTTAASAAAAPRVV